MRTNKKFSRIFERKPKKCPLVFFFSLDKLEVVGRSNTDRAIGFTSLPPLALVIDNLQDLALGEGELVVVLRVSLIRVQGTGLVSIISRRGHNDVVIVLLTVGLGLTGHGRSVTVHVDLDVLGLRRNHGGGSDGGRVGGGMCV